MTKIKRIGVFTSGGDAPGMNAAIRAVVRAGMYHNLEVYGIMQGYEGMIGGKIKELKSSHVSGIIQHGGTILKSARSQEFRTYEGRKLAYEQLKAHGIDAVVAIGGDGTFTGAKTFSEEFDIPFVGIPGTIDNDLYGTDFTIGYDTCLNTVMEAVDKIRDTASAHDRMFFIEVMGRDAGFIALNGGLACGAEAVFIPEIESHTENLKSYLEDGFKRKKSSNIILVAEGDEAGGAIEIAKKVQEDMSDYDVRVSILGHIQRGGSPSASDRILATRLGVAAVEALLDDQKSIMVGLVNNKVVHVPFSRTIKHHNAIDLDLVRLIDILNV
ncbi:MAG TPA: 6-phosphofructokinase [Bacteroidales bacterium]|nr:MAG: 6-phosphofructokinase [Bacteroidetes bacterium GWF2_33_38]OFY74571.1 MAG: 6-phosphofructokinase [Bacteroidetes bacterium RIFOXYA12_FULL_33_9]OFY89364.1 MAG: 6-phosphofructokinase [Bacteroidetes bacterium RIFOXYA2_FULL_33_7]HBF88091.1 6-phosphofructokinase [Bacteroidales bacterium]